MKIILSQFSDSVRAFITGFFSLRWIRALWMYLLRIIERMEDNHIFLSAGAISFNSLLCFIPLVLILFYILGLYLDVETTLVTIDSWLDKAELVPVQREQVRGMVSSILREFIGGAHIAGLVGFVGLIWTASALFSALRTILNQIFNIKDTKNLVVSKLKDFAMLSIIGIALVVLTVLIYGMAIVQSLGEKIAGGIASHWLFETVLSSTGSLVLSFLIFCAIFLLIPDRRLPARMIVLSSGVAAGLWLLAKFVFGYYLTNLWDIGKIYGPYAVLVSVAIWVYYSSITLLLSAEIGEMYIERKRLRTMFESDAMQKFIDRIRPFRLIFGRSGKKSDPA